MIHRTSIGSDTAQLALWDAQHAWSVMEPMSQDEVDEALRADAIGGRIFYINTGADGGCDVALYIDKAVPEDSLIFYKSLNRRFLLRCPSGRLHAGGAEEYTSSRAESASQVMRIPSGDYVLQLHELCEGDLNDPERLANALGEEDYAYLREAKHGWGWGCLSTFAGALLGYFIHWTWGLPFVVAGAGWILQIVWRNRRDTRLKEIESRVSEYNDQYAFFLFTLQHVDADTQLKGGWHNLDD